MHEFMFQAGIKGMSEQSELIPCIAIYSYLRSTDNPLTLSASLCSVFCSICSSSGERKLQSTSELGTNWTTLAVGAFSKCLVVKMDSTSSEKVM